MRIDRAGIHRLDAPGAAAECVVVLTTASWSSKLGDCIAVPAYRRDAVPAHDVLQPAPIDEDQLLRVDATLVQTIPAEWIGPRITTCTGTPWDRVRIAVRLHLCIDQLRSKRPSAAPSVETSEWWPRQGSVRYRRLPETGTGKLHAVVSADAWNASSGLASAVRLTSRLKEWRSPLEVPVPGGVAIVSDLWPIPNRDFTPEPPPAPRPDLLAADELAMLAARLQIVLGLS